MKKTTIPKIKAKLWVIFSKYMRLKVGRCQKCGKTDCRLEAHHVVPKSHGNAVYFNEKNIIVLCFYHHRMWFHGKATIEECKEFAISIMGEDVYYEMHRLGKTTLKLSVSDFEKMIIDYKAKLKKLEDTI